MSNSRFHTPCLGHAEVGRKEKNGGKHERQMEHPAPRWPVTQRWSVGYDVPNPLRITSDHADNVQHSRQLSGSRFALELLHVCKIPLIKIMRLWGVFQLARFLSTQSHATNLLWLFVFSILHYIVDMGHDIFQRFC